MEFSNEILMESIESLHFWGCHFVSSQLTYPYNFLTYQLPDRIKQSIGFGKLFHSWVCEGYIKVILMHANV